MRPLRLIAMLGLLAGAAAPAPGGPDAREYASTARSLAALTPGKPTTCISLSRSRDSSFLDPDTIVYRDTLRRYYVNRTNGGCRFDIDSIVVTSTPSDQLCRGDIIRMIDRTTRFETGACALGDFVPYERAPGAPAHLR